MSLLPTGFGMIFVGQETPNLHDHYIHVTILYNILVIISMLIDMICMCNVIGIRLYNSDPPGQVIGEECTLSALGNTSRNLQDNCQSEQG